MPSITDIHWHTEQARKAEEYYLASLTPESSAGDWSEAVKLARTLVRAALNASNNLHNVESALQSSGAHMRVFRHALAPPKSQDQFKHICGQWSKSSEVNATRIRPDIASRCGVILRSWWDRKLTAWVESDRDPTTLEKRAFESSVVALIASQEVATETRKRLAAAQESQVVELLLANGWTKLPASPIDVRAALPAKHFMHRTRFATSTATPQEVDIACGLPETYVLAMECKVTNDHTNSVKRINDVLKKSDSWRSHWGSFIETAAMLQGVIKPNDIRRLLDAGVLVFWSHEVTIFEEWLRARVP